MERLDHWNRLACLVFIPFCIAGIGGCGGASDAPELAYTTGTVNFDGKPLPNATVAFSSSEQGKGYKAGIGTTDSSGRFVLRSYDQEGVVLGGHQVSVSCTDPDSWPKDENGNRMSPLSPGWTPQVSIIPVIYGNPSQSGLTADVKSGEDNEFTFEIDSDCN